MKKIILLFLSILLLNSCGGLNSVLNNKENYVALDEALIGKSLDRASEVSLNDFFDKMMSNDIISDETREKEKFYQIIYNTNSDVYFGIIDKDGFNREVVKPFYKVKYDQVATYFPGYQEIDGAYVKQFLYDKYFFDMVEQEVKPVCFSSYNITYPMLKLKLTEKGIVCEISCTAICYESKMMTKKVNCVLNPSNLEVISEEIKDIKY